MLLNPVGRVQPEGIFYRWMLLQRAAEPPSSVSGAQAWGGITSLALAVLVNAFSEHHQRVRTLAESLPEWGYSVPERKCMILLDAGAAFWQVDSAFDSGISTAIHEAVIAILRLPLKGDHKSVVDRHLQINAFLAKLGRLNNTISDDTKVDCFIEAVESTKPLWDSAAPSERHTQFNTRYF